MVSQWPHCGKILFYWGNIEGTQVSWYENGNKANEGFSKGGKRVGLWNFWDEQGKLQDQVEYQSDQAHEIGFYTSGVKKVEGYFHQGKKLGTWIYWDEKGKEKGKCQFMNGVFDKRNKACADINELFPTESGDSEEENGLYISG